MFMSAVQHKVTSPSKMVLTGMCNGCGNEHLRPWGNYCKYLKAAIAKCKELNVSEDDFKLHVDFDAMATDVAQAQASLDAKPPMGSGSGTAKGKSPDTVIDQDTVLQLLDITHQQRTQIDDLIHHFKSLPGYTVGPSVTKPHSTPPGGVTPPAHSPAPKTSTQPTAFFTDILYFVTQKGPGLEEVPRKISLKKE